MLWTEIALNTVIDDSLLQAVTADLFGISVEAVAVTGMIDAATPDPWQDAATHIVVERFVQVGDYPLTVSFLIGDQSLANRFNGFVEAIKWLSLFCRGVDCDGITADDTDEPARWLLIRRTGEVVAVDVDLEALDDDRFVLAHVPALTGSSHSR